MRRFIIPKEIILLLIVILLGCSGDDSSTNANNDDQQNQPPLPPSSLTGYALSDSSIYLSWLTNSADVTGFTIHRCQTDSFIPADNVPGSQRYYVDYSLDEMTTYSYYVIAVNTMSSNSPPNPPADPVPADNAVNQPTSVNLCWDCTDPDDGDTLIYNLFFGVPTDSVPPLIASDLVEPTYYMDQLSNAATYEWLVIAIWSFITEEIP